MKPVTGQYECVHSSGVGLDYFTSRIDRLTLLASGRFTFVSQDRSRLANAAQSLMSGQQVSTAAPETRREGYYTIQGNGIVLRFDDGTQQQGQLSWNGDGVQLGQSFFNKVSDSTMLPPTHRMKMDMEDIAKGIKIAGAISSAVVKGAKTIHDTIQSAQTPLPTQQQVQPVSPVQGQQAQAGNMAPHPLQQAPTQQSFQAVPPVQQQAQPAPMANPNQVETLFCDQCGARVRPGKRFCNNCGARLP